jgi:hypothetical protein
MSKKNKGSFEKLYYRRIEAFDIIFQEKMESCEVNCREVDFKDNKISI